MIVNFVHYQVFLYLNIHLTAMSCAMFQVVWFTAPGSRTSMGSGTTAFPARSGVGPVRSTAVGVPQNASVAQNQNL